MSEEKKELFAVFAEVQDFDRPLILTDLTFARLVDDIIFPFENEEPFFIDGVPVSKKKVRMLKILRQKDTFLGLFEDLHITLRRGETERQKTYGQQYHTRLEAILREGCEDVTSQVIKAFDSKIKPHLKDYLPKRKELIEAASAFFWEGVKKLSGM
jgi:hypothetical protein